MNPTTYEEFKNLLNELNQEKDDIQKQIDDNTWQIVEARSYAQEILDREEEDFKVFSPRKIEDIYKEELHEYNVKQSDYENRNQDLIAKREKLDSIVLVLEKVWEEISVISNREEMKDEEDIEDINKEDNEQENIESSISEDILNTNEKDKLNILEQKEVIENSVQKLNSLVHKIDVNIKFMRQDPMRAKMELESVNKSIMNIADDLSYIIE